MSGESRHDQETSRLIEAALRAHQTRSGDDCPDPEAIAAWADGRLDAAGATSLESHVAGCERCLDLVAVFAQATDAAAEPAATGPARPATVRAFPPPPARTATPRARPRWLIPAAAGLAAAALTAAVAWPLLRESSSAPASLAADSAVSSPPPELASAPSASPLIAAAPVPSPATTTAANQAATASARLAEPQAAAAPPARQEVPPPPALLPPAGRVSGVPPPTPQAGATTMPMPPPAPPAIGPKPAAPPPTPAAAAAQAAADASAMARADRSEIKVAAAAESVRFPIEFGPPTTQGGAGGGRAAAGGRGGGGVAGGAMLRTTTAVRDLSRIRWRILASGAVERSLTGGSDWSAAPLVPKAFVVAGSAPSPNVCWLVGRDGLVLRTIDGETFTRVDFPEKIDLIAVTAADNRHATVDTRDGRTFVTADAGQTWTRR